MKSILVFLLAAGLCSSLQAQDQKPENIVQRQLDAYNAQNLSAFAATYSDSIEIFRFPSRPTLTGKASLEKSYGELFAKYPNNRAAVLNRIVQGNHVIDQEKVTGRGDRDTQAPAIYEVKNGLIRRVWFIY
jgi:hypothetical protein